LSNLLWPLCVFLLGNLVVGLWRALRGPTAADRMLVSQLFGTTAVAILLIQARIGADAALRDVALVFALLAAISAIAFVRRTWQDESDD